MASQPPAAPTAPAAASEPASVQENNFWDEPTGGDDSALVADVFGLDFGTPAEPVSRSSVGTEEEAGPEATPAPASNPPAAPAPVQPPAAPNAAPAGQQPAPATPPQPNPQELELASLRARLESAEALLAQQPAPQQAPGQPEGQAPRQPQVIPVQLPQEMLSAIFNEDPVQAAHGLNTLVSMLATGMNARAEAHVSALRQEMEQRFAGQVQQAQSQQQQQTATEQAKTARESYFALFPDHNKPILMATLAQEADALAAEFPGVPWDSNFNAALGQRVNAKLQEAGWSTQPAPAAPNPAPRPAGMLPAGVRPAPTDSELDLISETFTF